MASAHIMPAQPRQTIPKNGTKHNLLATVNVLNEDNRPGADEPAWVGGFAFQPESCNEVLTWSPCLPVAGLPVRVRGPIDAEGNYIPVIFDADAPITITVTDLGGGIYEITVDDPAQAGIVSDPNGAPNNADGYCPSPDGNTIFYTEFSLNGGGGVPAGIFVLDVPASQITASVTGPSGTGAFATNTIDTNIGYPGGLSNNSAALFNQLIETYGSGFTLGTIPSATEITVREVRCDSVVDAPSEMKVVSDNPETVEYSPYELYTTVRCRRYAEGEDPEFDRKAQDELNLGTTKAVECELWEGERHGAINPFCLNPNPSLVGSTGLAQILNPQTNPTAPTGEVAPISPDDALASLIQALGNCGPGIRGMIHGTLYVVDKWNEQGQLVRAGTTLETATAGHLVVAGAGYKGTAPLAYRSVAASLTDVESTPANTAWAYATGIVQVLVTDPKPIAFDNPQVGSAHGQQTVIDENRTTVFFERTAAAVWDLCCTFAVLVDMCGD